MKAKIEDRIAALDWSRLGDDLDAYGNATIAGLLSPEECRTLTANYEDDGLFRKRVIMEAHGYGRGEYKYFAYPLPDLVQQLRTKIYPQLAPIANRWNERLGSEIRYPPDLESFLARCHAAGQSRPTPLMLRYGPDGYNRLHQDVYGAEIFPLQGVILLSRPSDDFSGGEFVLTEQRPRMQSRPEVVSLRQGEAVIFAVHSHPLRGSRGIYRANLRHGVSRIRSGHRQTLGLIFHDAA